MYQLNRRALLAGGVAAGAVVGRARPLLAEVAAEQPLRDIASARGIRYGSTVMASQLLPGDPFTDLLVREAALLVTENEMKWSHMSTAPFEADYRIADYIVDFAARHGLACKGHNLLWFAQTPRWFKDLPSRAAARSAMLRRVEGKAGRYRGRIDSWDVVNEPVDPDSGRADQLRTTLFLDKLGPEYLPLAYRAARAADPKAQLVLNEYDLAYDTPRMDRKRYVVLKVLEKLRRDGVPVDVLGVEAHLAVGRHAFSEKKLRDFLAAAAAMGLAIQITELDCADAAAPADIAERDRLVAGEYRRFLDVALDEPAVETVITWGLSDRYSWLVRHEASPIHRRSDGMAERPLPFDRDLRRKPAWHALAAALAAAPVRGQRSLGRHTS